MAGTTKTQTIEELRAQRTSTSNKLSGVNTQIKRNEARSREAEKAGDAKRQKKAVAKLGQLEKRLGQLLAERDKLNVQIRELAAPAPAPAAAAKDAGKPKTARKSSRKPKAAAAA